VIGNAAYAGACNVLVNILRQTAGHVCSRSLKASTQNGDASGDVKYHPGYSRDVATANGPIHLTLGFNPSHLEIITR